MKGFSFFKKDKKERDDFQLPVKNFDYDPKQLDYQPKDFNIKLIQEYEIYTKECEKSFNKSHSQLEDLKKSEASLHDRLQKAQEKYTKEKAISEEDLRQLRTGYHKVRKQNEDLTKENKTMKQAASMNVESALKKIHEIVVKFVQKAKPDKEQQKLYEVSLENAETIFTSIENQFSVSKDQVEAFNIQIKEMETERANSLKKMKNIEIELTEVKTKYAKTAVELTKVEQQLKPIDTEGFETCENLTYNDLKERYNNLSSDYGKLNSRILDTDTQNETLQMRLEALNQEVEFRKNQLKDKNSIIKENDHVIKRLHSSSLSANESGLSQGTVSNQNSEKKDIKNFDFFFDEFETKSPQKQNVEKSPTKEIPENNEEIENLEIKILELNEFLEKSNQESMAKDGTILSQSNEIIKLNTEYQQKHKLLNEKIIGLKDELEKGGESFKIWEKKEELLKSENDELKKKFEEI